MKQTWFTDLVVNIWFYCSNMYPMALILFPPLSKPSWSASFPQDSAPFGWLLIPNPIKELHEQQWFWSLLTIPILTLERSLRSLKALNPSLLQLCCKEELLPINFGGWSEIQEQFNFAFSLNWWIFAVYVLSCIFIYWFLTHLFHCRVDLNIYDMVLLILR